MVEIPDGGLTMDAFAVNQHAKLAGVARAEPFDPCAAWPEPDARLLNGGPRKAPAFPLDCLGSLGSWVADLAAAKRAPVDFVAAPLLAFAAGVVGAARAVRIQDAWLEPLIIWVASVGNPSSGKSPALGTLKRALLEVERRLASSYSTVGLAAVDGDLRASGLLFQDRFNRSLV